MRYIILHDWKGRGDAERALSRSPRYMLLGEFGDIGDIGASSALLYQRRD